MSTNPFSPFKEELRALLFVDGGSTYQAGLSVIQGLLGVSIVLIGASLWIRLKHGEHAWLFRVQRTPSGNFLRPHYVYSALTFSLIFIIRESHHRPVTLSTTLINLCSHSGYYLHPFATEIRFYR